MSSSHDPDDIRLDLFDSLPLMKTPLIGADGGTSPDVTYLMYKNRVHVHYFLLFVIVKMS